MSRLAAPKAWMLDKLGGAYAPKPSPGPHKQRECLPLSVSYPELASEWEAAEPSPVDLDLHPQPFEVRSYRT